MVGIRALVMALALAAGPAFAQTAEERPPPADRPVAAAGSTTANQPPPAAQGATIQLQFVDLPNSRTSRRGDTFTLRVTAPALADGNVVVPEGAIARGEVIDAWPSDSGGKPGMLVLSIRTLELEGQPLALATPTLMLSGQDNIDTVHAASLVISPLLVLVEGRDVEVRPNTQIEAIVISASARPQTPGQIVFFRPRRNSAAVYRYGVREGETEVRLRNGTYSAVEVTPGVHEFSMVGTYFGPRPSETLRLSVQPGETVYVEHAIAFLVVSNQAAFEAHTLRPLEE